MGDILKRCLSVSLVAGVSLIGPAAAQVDNAQLLKAAKADGEILWYTSDTPNAVEGLAREFTKLYGVKVNASRKDAVAITQQYKTETSRGKSPVDVLTLLGMGPVTDIAPLLARFIPAGAAKLGAQYRMQDIAYAYSVSPMGIIYNTKLVSEQEVQLLRSYDGWLNPRFANRIAMSGPFGGTTGSNMQMLQDRKGIEFIRALVEKQKAVILQNTGPVGDAVVSGEYAIGLNVTPSLVSRAAQGAPIRFMTQDEWSLVVPAMVAISANAPHPAAARLFVEWLLTPEAQKLHDELSYWMPTLPGVRPDYPKAAWLTMPKNPVVTDDPAAFERRFVASMKNWRALFGW